jgi:hypothetical protein
MRDGAHDLENIVGFRVSTILCLLHVTVKSM